MGLSTQEPHVRPELVVAYEDQSRRLKHRLYVELAAWKHSERKSLDQFADVLSHTSGRKITAKKIEHWLSDDPTRQIPAPMLYFWRKAIRGGIARGEALIAESLIDAREFEVYQNGD